jgi:hypothetical protein
VITLKKLAHLVWSYRRSIEFGQSPKWDEETFLQSWVDDQDSKLWANKPGWYWLESDITLTELENLGLPPRLPEKATRFNEVARFNKNRLAPTDIYTPHEGQLNVVYNGHEGRIFSRLRLHFSLTERNTGTGALGISSYPLSNRKWRASFFHEGMIDKLNDLRPEDRNILRVLIDEKHSRELIETCWRIEYGWPALCVK